MDQLVHAIRENAALKKVLIVFVPSRTCLNEDKLTFAPVFVGWG